MEGGGEGWKGWGRRERNMRALILLSPLLPRFCLFFTSLSFIFLSEGSRQNADYFVRAFVVCMLAGVLLLVLVFFFLFFSFFPVFSTFSLVLHFYEVCLVLCRENLAIVDFYELGS